MRIGCSSAPRPMVGDRGIIRGGGVIAAACKLTLTLTRTGIFFIGLQPVIMRGRSIDQSIQTHTTVCVLAWS